MTTYRAAYDGMTAIAAHTNTDVLHSLAETLATCRTVDPDDDGWRARLDAIRDTLARRRHQRPVLVVNNACPPERLHFPMPANCPSCGTEFTPDFVTDATKNSRCSVTYHPKNGALMQAAAIGESLANFADLMKAVATETSATVDVLVEKIDTTADGAITAHFLVTRRIDKVDAILGDLCAMAITTPNAHQHDDALIIRQSDLRATLEQHLGQTA